MKIFVERRNSNEISGKHNEVRTQFPSHGQGVAQGNDGEVIVVMDVAQLEDGKPVKGLGTTRKRNLETHEFRVIGLDQNAVGRNRTPSGEGHGGGHQKFSSSESSQTACTLR